MKLKWRRCECGHYIAANEDYIFDLKKQQDIWIVVITKNLTVVVKIDTPQTKKAAQMRTEQWLKERMARDGHI